MNSDQLGDDGGLTRPKFGARGQRGALPFGSNFGPANALYMSVRCDTASINDLIWCDVKSVARREP